MTIRTTPEFERVTETKLTKATPSETVNAEVTIDTDSVRIDFPAPGRRAYDLEGPRAPRD